MQDLFTTAQATQWLQERAPGVLTTDSREVSPGDAFVAWPGSAIDARKYVAAAFEKGATCCLVERSGAGSYAWEGKELGAYTGLKADCGTIASGFFGEPSRELAVIAVTGTNGKTSTAWWLAQALSALPAKHAIPCGVIGTLGIGRPPVTGDDMGALQGQAQAAVTATGLTTPDPVLLQRTLRRFVDEGLRACAIEASSIGIEEDRLTGTRVRVAVFTNFTQDHLDYHATMDAYWQAKRKLFAWPGLTGVVLNVDDSKGADMAASMHLADMDVWTVSCQGPARLQAKNITYGENGLRFDVQEGATSLPLQTRMIGTYNVSNLLGVLAAMRALGVPLSAAVQVCSTLHPVPGRMECLGGTGLPLVAVDYAHTPDALAQALAALRTLALQRGGKLWCVFGCGGDRDSSKRPLMGAIAAQHADQVVVTSDNPRGEKPEAIIAQILLGVTQNKSVTVQADRAKAIAQVLAAAGTDDVVLIAGKGHEEAQEIAGVKTRFSDRTHAAEALQVRRQVANGVRT
jgi:UDP-N-acetylmuramyl-tripeptide synthetase